MSMFAKFVSSCVNFKLPSLEYSTIMPINPKTQPAIRIPTITQKPVLLAYLSLFKSSVGRRYSISASEMFKA